MAHLHRWALAFLGFWVGIGPSRLDRAIAASATFPHRAAPLQADIHRTAPKAAAVTFAGNLAAPDPRRHRRGMFSISDKEIAAIQAAFERGGELSATIEVRRIFPGIPNNAEARRIALTVAGWEAMPANPREP